MCNYYTFFYLNYGNMIIWGNVVILAINLLYHFNMVRYIGVGDVHVLANKQLLKTNVCTMSTLDNKSYYSMEA